MDPYEYLLNKLNVMLEFLPEFNTHFLYKKLETCKKILAHNIPIGWTSERIFKYFRTIHLSEYYRICNKERNKELDVFCRQLNVFPNDLESKEHVDLLLTVNGLNIEA